VRILDYLSDYYLLRKDSAPWNNNNSNNYYYWRMGEMRDTIFWLENLKGRDHLEDLGVDGEILEWILGEQGRGMDWIHLAQDRDQWGGPCEHGNEPSGFTKGEGRFLD
jgi:hypothetical protein